MRYQALRDQEGTRGADRRTVLLLLLGAVCCGGSNAASPVGAPPWAGGPQQKRDHDVELGCAPTQGPTGQGALIWQGFHHQWLRQIAGQQTPHRISKLAAFFDGEQHASNPAQGTWLSTANAYFGYGPGVDGDHASPNLRFAAAYSDRIRVVHGAIRFRFSDTTQQLNPLTSENRLQRELLIPRACFGDLQRLDRNSHTAVLRGIALRTSCSDAKQPPGKSCNSDGMWAHRLAVGIDNCSVSVEDAIVCRVRLEIFRSFNPDGTKPYNHVLDFDVQVFYSAVAGPESAFAALPVQRISETAKLTDGPLTGMITLPGRTGYAKGTVGLHGFGFELHETGIHKNRGRYLTTVSFGVEPMEYVAREGTLRVKYQMGLGAPNSTFPADASYHLDPVLLLFAEDAQVAQQRVARGHVCVSGIAFDCKALGQDQRTEDTVELFIGAGP
jgi:hypothetical protein